MKTLDEAIVHAREVAEYFTMKSNELYERQYEASLSCNECAKDNEQIADWLEELAKRREADRWIPVSERLPEKEGDYLVDRKERHFAIEHFYFSIADGTPYWSGMCKVYAWRPLPEHYTESEAENEQD